MADTAARHVEAVEEGEKEIRVEMKQNEKEPTTSAAEVTVEELAVADASPQHNNITNAKKHTPTTATTQPPPSLSPPKETSQSPSNRRRSSRKLPQKQQQQQQNQKDSWVDATEYNGQLDASTTDLPKDTNDTKPPAKKEPVKRTPARKPAQKKATGTSTQAARKRNAKEKTEEKDKIETIDAQNEITENGDNGQEVITKEATEDVAMEAENDGGEVPTPVKKKTTAKKTPAATKRKPAAKSEKGKATKKVDTGKKNVSNDEPVDSPIKKAFKGKGVAKSVKDDELQFDPDRIRALQKEFPDPYWRQHAAPYDTPCAMISEISKEHPLRLVDAGIRDDGSILGLALSPDGSFLATFSNMGSAKIWDTETFQLLTHIRDKKEAEIDEFIVGVFTPDCAHIAVGGKLKNRKEWSEDDEDNQIMPCPLKIFDVIEGTRLSCLEGHAEEIISIKLIYFKGTPYYVTTSQDGFIFKWKMDRDCCTLLEKTQMEDGLTCMAFTVSFVPNTGNIYFMAACDAGLRLFDFESGKRIASFEDVYSQYLDCAKFITPVDGIDGEDTSSSTDGSRHAYFLSRGVEILDSPDKTIATKPNSCMLHKLVYPKEKGGSFELVKVKTYLHSEYQSNSWLIRITSNGRYLMAPTNDGQVIIFNLESGNVAGILKDHDEVEVRDVKFHPTRKLFFSCGDDGYVKVYSQEEEVPMNVETEGAREGEEDAASR